MAKSTKKSNKTKGPSRFRRFLAFWASEKFRYPLGLFLIIFGIYLLVSFVSYLFSGNVDHSKLDLSWRELIFNSGIEVENIAGKTGAFLGETIINRGFGIPSFVFIFLLVITALRLFGVKSIRMAKSFAYSLVLLAWFSLALGLVSSKFLPEQYEYLGGMYGLILSGWLCSIIGTVGASFLLSLILFVIVIVAFSSFIPWLNRLFSKKEESSDVPVIVDQDINIAEEAIEPENPSISKIITEEDLIEAIFDPDSLDEPEFESNFSGKDVLKSIESQQMDVVQTKTEDANEPDLLIENLLLGKEEEIE